MAADVAMKMAGKQQADIDKANQQRCLAGWASVVKDTKVHEDYNQRVAIARAEGNLELQKHKNEKEEHLALLSGWMRGKAGIPPSTIIFAWSSAAKLGRLELSLENAQSARNLKRDHLVNAEKERANLAWERAARSRVMGKTR